MVYSIFLDRSGGKNNVLLFNLHKYIFESASNKHNSLQDQTLPWGIHVCHKLSFVILYWFFRSYISELLHFLKQAAALKLKIRDHRLHLTASWRLNIAGVSESDLCSAKMKLKYVGYDLEKGELTTVLCVCVCEFVCVSVCVWERTSLCRELLEFLSQLCLLLVRWREGERENEGGRGKWREEGNWGVVDWKGERKRKTWGEGVQEENGGGRKLKRWRRGRMYWLIQISFWWITSQPYLTAAGM